MKKSGFILGGGICSRVRVKVLDIVFSLLYISQRILDNLFIFLWYIVLFENGCNNIFGFICFLILLRESVFDFFL